MNSFRLTVTLLALIGLCCSQFVSADIKAISKFLDSKEELRHDDNAEAEIAALREMHQQINHGLQKHLVSKKTSHLLDQMLEAASWVEQKNCNDVTYEFKFDRDFRQPGAASRVLENILTKRDFDCAKELLEKEQQRYSSLDAAQKAKVEKLEEITWNNLESGAFKEVDGYESIKAVSIAANDPYYLNGVENSQFYDSLLGLLESESHKERCQLSADEVKDLFKQHVNSPCQYYTNELREIYEEHEKKSERKIEYDDDSTLERGSLGLFDHQEFNHHLLGYQVCLRLTGAHEAEIVDQVVGQLKAHCQ